MFPDIQLRQLTSDDYIKAAKIVAHCPENRLDIVLNLLEKAGFDVRDERLFLEAAQEPMRIISLIDRFKSENKYTWDQMEVALGIPKDVIRSYYSGRRYPSPRRYKEITEKIAKVLDCTVDELLQQ